MNREQVHPHVRHPLDIVRFPDGWNDKILDWFTDHVLASKIMFNVALIIPLLAIPLSTGVKVTLGVISGSWIQWWALHALQRRQNVTDLKRDAKADADHHSLSHIALTVDKIHEQTVAEKQRLADAVAELADVTRAVLMSSRTPAADPAAERAVTAASTASQPQGAQAAVGERKVSP